MQKISSKSIKKELIAGLTAFLSVIYIVPLNATMVSATGMDFEGLLIASALITALSTALCAFLSNTPIIISVAMGLNAYFTYDVVLSKGVAWPVALGAVFISGFCFFVLSLTRFRQACLDSIPGDIKRAIGAGIGLFITFIGLNSTGFLKPSKDTIITIGDLQNPSTIMAIITLFLLLFFWIKKIRAGFLLAIMISTALSWILGITPLPEGIFALPDFSSLGKIAFKLDLRDAFTLAMLPIILSFLVTQLFDSLSIISSVGVKERLFEGKDGEKKLSRVLNADAAGSLGGALLGTTTVTTLVESQIGLQAGAKNAISAIFVAILFALSLFMLPIFKAIPGSAIYPMLIMIGVMMFDEVGKIDFKDKAIGVSSFFIIILMPLTYSMTLGFALGFMIFIFMCILGKEFKRLNLGVLTLGLISLLVIMLSV